MCDLCISSVLKLLGRPFTAEEQAATEIMCDLYPHIDVSSEIFEFLWGAFIRSFGLDPSKIEKSIKDLLRKAFLVGWPREKTQKELTLETARLARDASAGYQP
ncbi:hypothetical protein C4E44_04535 [Pseudomonas sp. MWU12-2312b]|nr:hypothetical protein C4E44_04535 [Pseudomonas sp. MWU12-2312b]